MTRARVNRLIGFGTAASVDAFARIFGPATGAYYRWLARVLARERPAAVSVLDVGTGPGLLLIALDRHYRHGRLVGLDSSEAMLLHARGRVSAAALAKRVQLVRGTAYRLPFRSRSFDFVFATGLLHHLDDPSGFFREAARILMPGGLLVAVGLRRDASCPVRAMAHLHGAWVRSRATGLDGLGRVLESSWTRGELERDLRAAGFAHLWVQAGLVTLRIRALAPVASS